MRRRERGLKPKRPAPDGLPGAAASAALRDWAVGPPRPASRAWHPLAVPDNAARVDYSDRLLGFDEVTERHWPAYKELAIHEHEFHVKALVVNGDMWLTVEGQTHHLTAGSTFELDAQLPHAERYGGEGATYWVARRHRAFA